MVYAYNDYIKLEEDKTSSNTYIIKKPIIKDKDNEQKKIYVLYNPEIIGKYDRREYIVEGERKIIRNGIIEVEDEKTKDILENKGFYLIGEK